MRILQVGLMLGAAALAMPTIAAEPAADAILKTYADIALAAYSDSLAGAENLETGCKWRLVDFIRKAAADTGAITSPSPRPAMARSVSSTGRPSR